MTLNPNGGSGSNQTVSATYDAAMPSKIKNTNNNITAPIRDGYDFAGYYDAQSGGTKYYDADLSSARTWDKAEATTLYAHWTPHTYSVVFNGNGKTSGGMSNESFTFGEATKALSANAYFRVYTVTYAPNGGTTATTTEANTTATYTFNGWEDRNSIIYNGTTYTYATFDAPYYANTYSDLYDAFGYNKYSLIQHYVNHGNGEGRSIKGENPGLYPNNASVANLTTEANGTVTLYANWSSASVTLPSATRENHVIEGWYNGSVDNPANKVGVPGDSYTPTENTTLTAKWIARYPFTMSGSDRTMEVGDELPSAFTFTYAENPSAHINITSISSVRDGDDVIEYDAEHNTLIARNAGIATIYFTQENTETIIEGTSDTWTVTVNKVKNTLSRTVATHEMYVGDELEGIINSGVAVANRNNTDISVTVTSEAPSIIRYDSANDKVIVPNDGEDWEFGASKVVNLIFSQPVTYKYTAASETIAVTVKKYASTIATSTNYNNVLVDADPFAIASYETHNVSTEQPALGADGHEFYYTIEHTFPENKNVNGSTHPNEVIGYNPANHKISAYNAGTAILTIAQKETNNYTGDTVVFNVSVTKNTNNLAYSWNGAARSNWETTEVLNFDERALVAFASDNSDVENSPIVVGVSSNPSIAVFRPDSITPNNGDSIRAFYNKGNVTWTVSQTENYKYYAATQKTLKANVQLQNETSCYLYEAPADKDDKNVSEIGLIDLGGIGNILTFQMKWDGTALGNDAYLYASPDGESAHETRYEISASDNVHYEWVGIIPLSYSDYDDDGNSKTIELPENTRYIRFAKDGSDNPKVRNIKVTRKTWLNVPDIRITKQDDGKTLVFPGTEGKGTLTIHYSLASGGPLKIVSDNSKFSFTNEKITSFVELSDYGCSTDSIKIPVYYLSEVEGEDVANIVIYNTMYREEATITGVTQSADISMLIWHLESDLDAKSTYDKFIASTDEGEISFSTDLPDLLTFSGNITSGYSVLVESVARDTTGYIAAAQGELKDTLYITIHPRSAACLPYIPTDNDDFRKARVRSEETVGWCNTNGEGQGSYGFNLYNVYYTQRKGISLGTWEDGLNGFNFETFSYSTKSVVISFNGVPDSIFFDVYSQHLKSVGKYTHATGNYDATLRYWKLEQSVNGKDFSQVGDAFESPKDVSQGTHIERDLDETTRYIKITYTGNFTGFIQNLRITQDKYLNAEVESLTFGDSKHPLQTPQAIKIYYSSIGNCGEDGSIAVTTTGAFYVDDPIITQDVDINRNGDYTIHVRCYDVNSSGNVTFTGSDGTILSVPVNSVNNPVITSSGTSIFQTGTEYNGEDPYRGLTTHDFSACFSEGNAIFDSLYIYGVSASAADNRKWIPAYKMPKIELEDGNVHTPCFVFKKNGTETAYEYVRTFDAATTTLDILTGDKIAFKGYKPADLKKSIPAIRVNGGTRELYLDSTEIIASAAALELNGVHSIYARLDNSLTSKNAATVKFIAPSTELIVNDNWASTKSGFLALNSKNGKPSIELNSATDSVIIRGSQLKLQNAKKMAIARMDGDNEKIDGKVHIYDGTIIGEDTLGMPLNTIIDGGTFNDGTVKVYNNGKAKRPKNSRGELLAPRDMYKAELESNYGWYGQDHLTVGADSKFHPMLYDTTVCVFKGGGNDNLASTEGNWYLNNTPKPNYDVIVEAPVVITETLTLNSLTIEDGENITVTINPEGGLAIGKDGIIGSTNDNLILKAGTSGALKGQTGFLRISPEYTDTMPHATVELFSKAYYDPNSSDKNNTASWQYVGIPVETKDLAKTFFANSRIYSWQESSGEWINDRKTLVMTPFIGYCTSQYRNENGMLITFKGQLVNRNDQEVLKLSYTPESAEPGLNVFANSYSAPIDITKIDVNDFKIGDDDDATIHLFNTGSRIDINNQSGVELDAESVEAAGQYIPIPVGSANDMKKRFNCPTVIAPMQGFFVKTTKKGSLTLRYEDVVWKPAPANTPMRSRRKTELDEDESISSSAMKVTLSSNGWKDRVYLLESEQYSTSFEKGIDARKMESGDFNIFVVADGKRLAVNATNSITNTYIGVRTGEEMHYTMAFTNLYGDTEWSLLDTETNEMTNIEEGSEYSFYAEPNAEIEGRFIIVERAQVPSTPTNIDGAEVDAKVQKFIKDNQLFVLKNGVLYNAQGKVVR